MAFPLSAYQQRYNFSLTRVGTKEDIAVFSLWQKPLGGAVYTDSQLAEAAHGGYNAWNTNVDPGKYSAAVTLESVTCTSYDASGKTLFEQNYVAGTPWQGASSGKALPWEVSLAVSLYTYPRGTFVQNGRRKRGRYYLPVQTSNQLANNDSGYYDDSLIAGQLLEQVSFLSDSQQDSLGVQIADLAVFSRMDGVLRPVTDVYIDAKFDSQRRRENREVAGVLHQSMP